MPRTATPLDPSRFNVAATSDRDDIGWTDELATVFAAELQEHLNHVPALASLLASPDTQAVACAKLSRLFHTIKGSAAVVGRNEISAIAKRLQDEFGTLAEQPAQHALPAAFLTTVQAALDELYQAVGQTAPELLHPIVAPPVELHDASVAAAAAQEPTELLQAFNADAAQAIDTSQRLLLDLERHPGDVAVLRQLFRHFHTLKGAAAAVGLERVTEQLHHGESLLEGCLEGRIVADAPQLVDFLLRLTDSLAGLVNAARGVTDHEHMVLGNVEAEVAALLSSPPAAPAAPTQMAEVSAASDGTARSADSDASSLRIDGTHLDALLDHVGQLLGARNRMNRRVDTLSELRDRLAAHRTLLAQIIETFREKYEFTANDPLRPAERGGALHVDREAGVELDRYDDVNILARSVIELTAHSREITEQLSSAIDALGDETAHLSHITSALRHGITRLRSVPLDHILRRLVRAVRDAARQEQKLVELQIEGGTLELDKSLVDRLHGPLLHLVRNAISHGIEPSAVRQARGKPPVGTVRIAATLQDRTVHLSVADDGAGINFNAIAARGRALGLIPHTQPCSREELLSLIFRPGFTTQQAVTDLAGRGVGMDAVAAEIGALNGSVTIDSHDAQGTTVCIALPVSTSIDEVLLVQAGTQLFALPVGLVDQVVPANMSDLLHRTPRTIAVQGEVLPALVLAPLVGEPAPMDHAMAVVLRAGGRAVALVVDRVQAQHEAVVRPLGPVLEAHPLLAGAVVSGTGAVILVLHVGRLIDTSTSCSDHDELRASSDAPSTAPAQGQAVLFVDDSISVRKVAAHFLETSGLEVDTAVDGIDAVEKLATGRFRIVVTDLEMPRMHGYELIGAIRRHPRYQHLPVIVCSSRSSDKHRERAREMGAQGYLTKPFTQEQLLTEIQRLSGMTPERTPLTDAPCTTP